MFSRSIHRAFVLPFLCITLLVSVLPSGSVAHAGDEEVPEFHQYIAEDRANFFYLSDLAPVIQRFLESEAGAKIVNTMSGGSQDAGDLLLSFESEAIDFIPDQLCIAMSNKSVAGIGRAIPLGMAFGLCAGAVQSGETDALDDLHPKLIESLKALKLEQADIWIRFRNEGIPSMIEAELDELSTELGEDSGVRLEYVDGDMNMTARVRDFMPPQLLIGTLFAMGLSDDLSDPDLKEASELIGDLALLLRIQRIGSAFLIHIGGLEPESEKHLALDGGELWKDEDSQLVFMRYDASEMSAAVDEAQAMWEKYAETPVGAAVREMDKEDLIGDLQDMVRQIGSSKVRGELRVTFAEHLTIDGWEAGYDKVKTIRESELPGFIPKSAITWVLATETSLADTLQDYLSNFEDQMANRSLREQMGTRRSAISFESLSEQYYEKMGEFRQVVRNDLRGVLVAPTAFVCSNDREPLSVEVRFFDLGGNNRVTLKDISVPRLALIARMAKDKDVGAVIQKAQVALMKAFDLDGDVALWKETQIEGLEYPAYTWSGDWQKGRLPKDLEVHCDGECRPHCLVLPDGWLILSTSETLTREICEAQKDESKRHKFSDDQLKASEIGFADSNALNNTFFFPIQLIRSIEQGELELIGEGNAGEAICQGIRLGFGDPALTGLLDTFAVVGSQISEMSLEARYEDGVRRVHGTMSFAE
ncbi:MAG: hypothetical protein U0996_19760 [Planctomycetaceae bacterium]